MKEARVKVQARPSETQCPLCWEPASAGREVRCSGCGTRYHETCTGELAGRCATLGCGRVLARRAPRPQTDYLDRYAGRRRPGARRRTTRLGRRWSQARARFSVLHALFGALYVGLFAFLFFSRHGHGPDGVGLVVATAITLAGAIKAGFEQDGFWTGPSVFGWRRGWRW